MQKGKEVLDLTDFLLRLLAKCIDAVREIRDVTLRKN